MICEWRILNVDFILINGDLNAFKHRYVGQPTNWYLKVFCVLWHNIHDICIPMSINFQALFNFNCSKALKIPLLINDQHNFYLVCVYFQSNKNPLSLSINFTNTCKMWVIYSHINMKEYMSLYYCLHEKNKLSKL